MTIRTIDLSTDSRITAFSTFRDADDPSGTYSGFNACHYTGDSPEHIDKCRIALCRMLGIDRRHLIIPRQTHSCNVAVIDSIPTYETALHGVDALVTRLPDTALCINTADCVPVLLYDPEAGVIAAAHSGWRGTVARIAAKTVDVMTILGAAAERIRAVMGPSICQRCFEVGEEVAARFRDTFPATVVDDREGCRPHIDLGAAIRDTLIESGLVAGNISLPTACSRCHPADFFSARCHGIDSGRTLSVIMRRSSW